MHYSVTEYACLLYWQELDTPKSLSLAIRLRYGDWVGILQDSVDPNDYLCPLAYHRDAAAVAFVKKNPFVKGSSDKERSKAAVDDWQKAEDRCFVTNNKIRSVMMAGGHQRTFLNLVRKQLLEWLGPSPSDCEIQQRGRHGPGSTFSTVVRNPTAADKYSEKPSVTRNAIWYLSDIVGTLWGDEISSHYEASYEDCIQVTRGNRYAHVPKTALKDRSIAIEPSINVYFQLALGSSIRDRLKRRCGWDLNTAADIHREMARSSSIDGRFATLDLSSASDTLSRELVTALLGDTLWYQRLDDLRSTHTLIDGHWKLLEKFSSMGNGYTFELETIIFASICSTVLQLEGHQGILGYDLFVFGDDIIIPTECAPLVQSALEFCGFQLNKSKSFTSGPFRESCGGDFFLGTPVRGYYLKRELDEPDVLFSCYNGTQKVLIPSRLPRRFLDWCLSRLPIGYRSIGGSTRLGDSVLHGLRPIEKWKGGVRWVKTVKWRKPKVVPWAPFSDRVHLACRLTGHGDSWGINSRGEVKSGEIIWVTDS